ncbi:Methionyl/Valyl/Leucyl/Isoleucyl-tRNA synthetase anticodon-binding [Arabidopsis suecica]|uniref:valine--tRNA ligase n=1 Tax=Arabidopsis suecica TaxID=45249 RepID=A0A8T2H825_ARASU|nr:Methionyl/Valyl/Leucyl/Isoleucyl-tRNA synthetase anticodon-binding [Arabidopsis suecica]
MVVGYRQWCNKLWNAVRFAMMKLGDGYTPPVQTLRPETMTFSCQWILSVLNKTISNTVDSLNAFELLDAANTVYAWWQYQFCDVFIEAIKPSFAADNQSRIHAQDALWVCLETGLRLLHPFMPYITEELWQRLPSSQDSERKASIMICDYPSSIEMWTNEKVETEMDMVLATVKTLRALRAAESLKRQRNEKFHAFALSGNALTLGIVKPHELEIRTLANLSSFEVMLRGEDKAFVVCWEEIEIWISYNVLYFILCKLCPSF